MTSGQSIRIRAHDHGFSHQGSQGRSSHKRWFALTVDLNLTEQATQRARNTVRCARNLGTARKEARVRTECATHAVKPAIPRANVHPKLSAYSTRAPKKRIGSTTDLATKCANVARNMATARHIVRNHDEKHAAALENHQTARIFECAEHKCSKCKGALDPKGHE